MVEGLTQGALLKLFVGCESPFTLKQNKGQNMFLLFVIKKFLLAILAYVL